jgi:hypothetical protein
MHRCGCRNAPCTLQKIWNSITVQVGASHNHVSAAIMIHIKTY